MKAPRDWTPGTGDYEGMVWDGRSWVKDGQAQRVTPWQRTTWPWKAFVWGAVVLFFGYVVWKSIA